MDEEQALAVMLQRARELAGLVKAFEENKKPIDRPWMAECMATTLALMRQADSRQQRLDAISILALAMWQVGYEAAPKLGFVLPEEGTG